MPYKDKEQQRQAQRNHYLANRNRYIQKARESNRRCNDRNRNYIFDYLLEHSCLDCEESDPIVLQFDHRGEKAKTADISDLARWSSLVRLQEEIEKCDVRCANCHLRKTAKEYGWYAYRAAVV